MKILKKAEQKNVVLAKEFYTPNTVNEMLAAHEIFYFDKAINASHEKVSNWDFDEHEFRIFTEDLNEIKVVLEDGYYTTVAIGKNGKTYFVTL